MAKKWENIDLSTVKTGDIEEATFTINKYVVEDGVVSEEEEDVPIGEEELEEVRDEVNSRMEQALREFRGKGEVESFDVTLEAEVDDPAEVGVSEEAQEPEEKEPEEDEGEDEDEEPPEPPEDVDPVEVGRKIVKERGIGKENYPKFAEGMRERGLTDQSLQSDVWNALKDEGLIERPEREKKQRQEESGDETGGAEPDEDEEVEMEEFGIPLGTDLLMVQQDEPASDMVVNALHDPISEEEIVALPITSDLGEAVIEPLSADTTTPFYLEATEDGFVKHPLEMLTDKYL